MVYVDFIHGSDKQMCISPLGQVCDVRYQCALHSLRELCPDILFKEPGLRSGYVSESAQSQLHQVCLEGISNFRVERREVKCSSKMAASATNQNCCFD